MLHQLGPVLRRVTGPLRLIRLVSGCEWAGIGAALRFAALQNLELILGPKVWIAVVLALLVIILGVLVTPNNTWAGIGIGVAGVAGAVLGTLLQPSPIPRDYTAEATSAVRGLLAIAEAIEDTQTLATQLTTAGANQRVNIGLISIQDDLAKAREGIYLAMGEWDAISNGALEEVEQMRLAGAKALQRLSRENAENERTR